MINLNQKYRLPPKREYLPLPLGMLGFIFTMILLAISSDSLEGFVFIIIISFFALVLSVFVLIVSLIARLFSWFIINEEELIFKPGLLLMKGPGQPAWPWRIYKIPLRSIQRVYTVRDLVNRIIGTSELQIWTTTVKKYSFADFRLVLTAKDAQWLKDFIEKRLVAVAE